MKVLHHELLPGLILLFAFFQASKLRCRWTVTTRELCGNCKSTSHIKGASEQVSAVHVEGSLSLLWGRLLGGHRAQSCQAPGFCHPCHASPTRGRQLQALFLVCRARKCPVLWVVGVDGHEPSGLAGGSEAAGDLQCLGRQAMERSPKRSRDLFLHTGFHAGRQAKGV